MDRNTIIGLLLIFLLIIGYSYFTKPSEAEIEAANRKKDSLQQVATQRAIEEQIKIAEAENTESQIVPHETTDKINIEELKDKFGAFASGSVGEKHFVTLENNLIKVKFSTLGGKIYSVQLKDFLTYDSLPLMLFDGDSTQFGLNFFAQNRSIITDNLYFIPVENEDSIIVNDKSKSVTFRVNVDENKYIEYKYILEPNSYMIDFDINLIGLEDIISKNTTYLSLKWDVFAPGQEKGPKWERENSTIYYKFYQDEVDYLTERSEEDSEELRTKIKWIAFKQQFFSSVLIAKDYFDNTFVKTTQIDDNSKYIRRFYTDISIGYVAKPENNIKFNFYFGPNDYNILKEYKLELQKLIPLGWGIFGWINRFAIIPLFRILSSFISNYGIIILVLTIIIKLVLFPLTYKSYLSTAKMRVLKPQIDEINKKYTKDKAMEKQKATMALYKKVGINPMGGCLPMLLQMPILLAMFRFFPASIELRQKSFLWADDLSAYDSIIDLPFEIPYYGDHVSLFCLLMAITNVIYTVMNNKMNPASTTQMPGMKTMMYMMPVMFLVWFNNYASGLSYYYFIATLFTIAQMLLIRNFVDDKAILKKLEAAKKKPAKKSKFQSKLENMAKQKGYKPPKK